MAKKKGIDLPNWAKVMWEDMGSPELEGLEAVHNGDLLERRQGLRRDDFIEIHMNVQAFANPEDAYIRGRLISSGKSSLEILTEDGRCHFISREVIVRLTLIAHTRPAYIDDKELLAFEREDMKRRSQLHEKVEKETTGDDDGHLWG
jgi:RNase P/RNase MRP subunit p29